MPFTTLGAPSKHLLLSKLVYASLKCVLNMNLFKSIPGLKKNGEHCGILVKDMLHLFMLWNICLMTQRCVAFFYIAFV